MDNLTHGLFGLAIGALRRPDRRVPGERASETDRAVPWACVLAAELPDLDALWPAETSVLQALQAHRGASHSLLAAPLVALIAALLVKLIFRRARLAPMFAFALGSTVFAHLLADAWTGWGTRLFLPFSDTRLSLDWTMVVDPLVTVPLAVGALWALRRRDRWRQAVLVGAAVATGYVALRVGARALAVRSVERHFAAADRIEVFPAALNPLRWRFVVAEPTEWIAGSLLPWDAPHVDARHPRARPELPEVVRRNETVREALAWARMPLVTYSAGGEIEHLVRVADLRYHWDGTPTLTFHLELDADGAVTESRLDRMIPGTSFR